MRAEPPGEQHARRQRTRSPINAAISVSPDSLPNSRKDGRSERTVTPSPKARMSEVSTKAGPISTVARSTPMAGSIPAAPRAANG